MKFTAPIPNRNVLALVWGLATVIALGLLAWLVLTVITQSDRLDIAQVERGALSETNDRQGELLTDQGAALDEANDRCEVAVDCRPVAVPGRDGLDGGNGTNGVDGLDGLDGESVTGPAGPRGLRGFIGPIGPGGLPGEDGADGRSGAAGPPGESIKGDPGDTGATGQDGESITGPAGKDGTDGTNGGDGVDGVDGAAGAAGAAGRGIQSVTCDTATEQFVVTYTDGTTAAVEGSDCVAGGPV